ncbi:MAG: ribbon-helix-helix protein, CopG family [Proteobacteria bacterium]|nr:ribbon-helix-helix protein, CopG family [Pseudomonadota bacterium]
MSQLNINLTADFSRALERLMRARGLRSKSEAVRLAVTEAAERATHASRGRTSRTWWGSAARLR